MSSLTTLARPYAKAAFELAQGEQSLADWDDMLSMASDIAVYPTPLANLTEALIGLPFASVVRTVSCALPPGT